MAAPDLTKRYTVFVQKQGTDDAGANAVGAPQSRLTIAAALADLAANYPAADSVSIFHIVALGPGNWAEDVVLPPGTMINGSCDGEGQPTSIVTVVEVGITLSAGWSANATAIGGFSNVTIRKNIGTPALDFTLPVPVAGNPSRTLILQNVRHNLASELFEATSTADVLRKTTCVQDGANTNTFLQTGGSSTLDDVTSAAAITIKDKTSFAAAGVWKGVVTGAGAALTVNSVAAAGCTLRMTASQPRTLIVTETAPGVIAVALDAVSLPINASVTYGGTAAATDVTLLDDAYGVGYTPAVPGNWPSVPTTVQAALDELAAAGGATPANAYAATANNAGNSTITPTARNYFDALTIGGAARTSVIILDITGRVAGDMISFDCVFPVTNPIVIEWRDAVVGGTLLDSFTTDGVTLTGTVDFIFTGAAWVLWQAVFGP